MADEQKTGPAGHFADEPTPGERLREARKAKNLDTREIASMLHIDPWMLDALEHDEYNALGAPVFAKGHLRKYATVLGLDPDELMVAYYQQAGTRETPPLIAESILRVEAAQRPRFAWLLPAAAAVVLFTLAVFAAMLYFRPDSGPAPARAGPVAGAAQADETPRSTRLALPGERAPAAEDARAGAEPGPAASRPAAQPADAAASAPATDDAPTRVAAVDAPAREAPAATPPPEPTADALTVTATLRFREESWVEVYDSERAKLLYGLGQPGTTRYLSGPAPLQVFLGNANGVDVQVDGADYEIPRGRRRGNTARFTVDKPAP